MSTNQLKNEILGEEEMQDKQESPHPDYPGSVLLSDHIEEFVKKGWLIEKDTFEDEQLDRAKYNVRLGRKYFQDNNFGELNDYSNLTLTIGAYELVLIDSYDIFLMPENIIGIYDLRISNCLSGLGLQTGLQIDPTYCGKIFCPVFNFSDETVRLRYKDHFASIHFIYTTPDTLKKAKPYGGKNYLFSLDKVLQRPTSTGVETVWAKIKEIQKQLDEAHKKLVEARSETQNVNTVFLAVVGLVLTAISAILVPEAIGRTGATSPLTVLIIGIVFLVTVFMLFRFVRSLFKRDNPESPQEKWMLFRFVKSLFRRNSH